MSKAGLIAILIAVVFFAGTAAYGHQTFIDVEMNEGKIHVHAYFPKKVPMKGARIFVLDGKDQLIVKGKANSDGRYVFDAPATWDKLTIMAKDLLGHKAEVVVFKEELLKNKSKKEKQ